jgi:hypothetical protein
VTDLLADTAAATQMFIDANEGALFLILTVGKGGTSKLIQTPSAHITFIGHPENHFLLLAGDTPFE